MPNGKPWGSGYCDGEGGTQQGKGKREHSKLEMQWAKLADRMQPGAQQRVVRSVSAWGQRIRDQLRNETGFRMSGKDGRVGVRVTVEDGIPVALSGALSDDMLPIAHLLMQLGLFQQAARGVRVVGDNLDAVGSIIGLPPDEVAGKEDLLAVASLLERLAAKLADIRLPGRILGLEEDVLGAYFYRRQVVRVYWVPISLLSASGGFPLEALSFVVIAHELAHAYTHVGLDINGFAWDTEKFADSTDELVEGFAQFYTERVCEHFEEQFPSALETFRAIKKCQPALYSAYENWPEVSSGEDMRRLLRESSGRSAAVSAPQQAIDD